MIHHSPSAFIIHLIPPWQWLSRLIGRSLACQFRVVEARWAFVLTAELLCSSATSLTGDDSLRP